MLRVTVELWLGGREERRRVLATANIARVRSGALADYEVLLADEIFGCVGTGMLHGYPRYAASVWDLVARSIAAGLSGQEELPPRPQLPAVPIHESDGLRYVRLSEIPEPAQTLFRANLSHSTRPIVGDDPHPMDCAYAWDWKDFLSGIR